MRIVLTGNSDVAAAMRQKGINRKFFENMGMKIRGNDSDSGTPALKTSDFVSPAVKLSISAEGKELVSCLRELCPEKEPVEFQTFEEPEIHAVTSFYRMIHSKDNSFHENASLKERYQEPLNACGESYNKIARRFKPREIFYISEYENNLYSEKLEQETDLKKPSLSEALSDLENTCENMAVNLEKNITLMQKVDASMVASLKRLSEYLQRYHGQENEESLAQAEELERRAEQTEKELQALGENFCQRLLIAAERKFAKQYVEQTTKQNPLDVTA